MDNDQKVILTEDKGGFRHNPWIWIISFSVLVLIALVFFAYWLSARNSKEQSASVNPDSSQTALPPNLQQSPTSSPSPKDAASSTQTTINILGSLISDLDSEMTIINEDLQSNDDEKLDL